MHILYSLTAYPPAMGGCQIHTHQLAYTLSKKHLIDVISFWDRNRTDWLLGTTINANDQATHYQIDGIDVHMLGFSTFEKVKMIPVVLTYYPLMRFAARKLAQIIEPKILEMIGEVDVIHNVRIGREPLSIASLNLAKKRGIPFIFTPVHHPRWNGWLYDVYINLYRKADGIIALTHSEKEQFIKLGVKEEKIYKTGIGPIIAPRAYPETFIRKYNIRGPIILFLGQHFPYKGFLHVLKSSKKVWEKIPDANFVFIGPGIGNSERYFNFYVDQRIYRLGKVDLQEKTNALAACSLLCLPSIQESFGGVFTEAWSFKKPVIGCSIPAVSELIADGEDGYLINQNSDEIADRIIYLLNNSNIAFQMGLKGYKKVQESYAWEKLAGATEQIYLQII